MISRCSFLPALFVLCIRYFAHFHVHYTIHSTTVIIIYYLYFVIIHSTTILRQPLCFWIVYINRWMKLIYYNEKHIRKKKRNFQLYYSIDKCDYNLAVLFRWINSTVILNKIFKPQTGDCFTQFIEKCFNTNLFRSEFLERERKVQQQIFVYNMASW